MADPTRSGSNPLEYMETLRETKALLDMNQLFLAAYRKGQITEDETVGVKNCFRRTFLGSMLAGGTVALGTDQLIKRTARSVPRVMRLSVGLALGFVAFSSTTATQRSRCLGEFIALPDSQTASAMRMIMRNATTSHFYLDGFVKQHPSRDRAEREALHEWKNLSPDDRIARVDDFSGGNPILRGLLLSEAFNVEKGSQREKELLLEPVARWMPSLAQKLEDVENGSQSSQKERRRRKKKNKKKETTKTHGSQEYAEEVETSFAENGDIGLTPATASRSYASSYSAAPVSNEAPLSDGYREESLTFSSSYASPSTYVPPWERESKVEAPPRNEDSLTNSWKRIERRQEQSRYTSAPEAPDGHSRRNASDDVYRAGIRDEDMQGSSWERVRSSIRSKSESSKSNSWDSIRRPSN